MFISAQSHTGDDLVSWLLFRRGRPSNMTDSDAVLRPHCPTRCLFPGPGPFSQSEAWRDHFTLLWNDQQSCTGPGSPGRAGPTCYFNTYLNSVYVQHGHELLGLFGFYLLFIVCWCLLQISSRVKHSCRETRPFLVTIWEKWVFILCTLWPHKGGGKRFVAGEGG